MTEKESVSLPYYYKCSTCEWHGSSFRASCPVCGIKDIEKVVSSGRGKIVDAVSVRFAPENLAALGQYTSVLVQFDEKFQMFGIMAQGQNQVAAGNRVMVSSYSEDTQELFLSTL